MPTDQAIVRDPAALRAAQRGAARSPLIQRALMYLLKAVVVLGVICVASLALPYVPSPVAALLWAVASGVVALGFAYPYVVRKLHRQLTLTGVGPLARWNAGRVVCLLVSFVLAAALMAGLMFSVPKWGVSEWVLAVVAIPLFFGVLLLVERVFAKGIKQPYQTSSALKWAGLITGALLCAVYALVCALTPAPTFPTAAGAFMAAANPFESSPSMLLSEAGTYGALIDGLTAFGLSQAADQVFVGYVVWKCVLEASVFFGISTVLWFCSIPQEELLRVFRPLGANPEDGLRQPLRPAYVIEAVLLPVLLVAAFMGVDAQFSQIAETQEYSAAKQFVRNQVNLVVVEWGGSYYEYQPSLVELLDDMKARSEALAAEAADQMVPLINASYDARLANVDSYLDWYYSLPADYERLFNTVVGTVDELVATQLSERIEAGIDDSQLEALVQSYSEQAAALDAEFQDKLRYFKLEGYPDWLVSAKSALDFSAPLQATQQLMTAQERFVAAGVAGLVAGIVAKQVVGKLVQKQFFKRIVAMVVEKLGVASASTAIGATVGTVGGPLGTAAGVLVGAGIGILVDTAMLKIDEAQNRASYREEIVAGIEESRADALAMVGAA
ncbi:MAG: hypothetical protein Q4E12_00955 [Coriobacteriia bacterium]|nr:hypothetical protein [Coriobacteriia bacterium]